MSKSQRLDSILNRAERREKKYEWLEAAELHKQALGAVGKKGFLKAGEIQERIGYCFQRGAFQAESNKEFRGRIQRAFAAYEKACELHKEREEAREFRCNAVAKYLGFWLSSDPSEKKRLLDACLALEGRALAVLSESGNMLEYAKTYNELPLIFWLRVPLEWNWQTLKGIIEKGQKWGEKAIAALSKHGDSYELAKANFILATCFCLHKYYLIAEPEDLDTCDQRIDELLSQAVKLAQEAGDAYLLGLVNRWFAYANGVEEVTVWCKKALEFFKLARDNLLIAFALCGLAFSASFNLRTVDPEKGRELLKESLQYDEEAERHFSILEFMYPFGAHMGPPTSYAQYYFWLGLIETDVQKRRMLFEKSERAGLKAQEAAEKSKIPIAIDLALHFLSLALEGQANLEPDSDRKRDLLKRALEYEENSEKVRSQVHPYDYWSHALTQRTLAGIKTGLADVELDFDRKLRLLEEAVVHMGKWEKLTDKVLPYLERKGFKVLFSSVQDFQDQYATLLGKLHEITSNPEHLRNAIEILHKAIESATKVDMVSREAESYWKIAKAQDILGEQLKAAENFNSAARKYSKAAEKISKLKDFYQDYSSYMKAWSEIEKARYHHAKMQHGQAKEHYEKAASLHKSTHQWNHLSPNYAAWARLEEAEDLSRREQTEEAKELFQGAANLFAEAEKAIQAKLTKSESKDEKELLSNLATASDIRGNFCRGRLILEEAKLLDGQGDHAASSRKYGSAAEIFKKAIDSMEEGLDRQEMRPILDLCKAWERMTQAEAEASPDLYLEASHLFDEAKEHSLDERAKLLALGHSSFCRALEAGTRFEAIRDRSLHALATQHLEGAASYYLRAGFRNASEYAEATQKLLDAYLYMHNAKTETDPTKKARLYMVTEKVLQASAGSYLKAKHPEKQEQVSRLLEKVKQERELALSLTEVLHAPLETSTTETFTTPTPRKETPTGLERFEHADIQASLILRVKEVKVGEDVRLAIELVNAGKAPALLIKVDEVVPAGFEIKNVPEMYTFEDSYVNLKGKRLNPLKTEDVKIVVNPRSKGTFIVKPRILYIDETGKYKSHEPDPVTITVKELGIKGWIRGER